MDSALKTIKKYNMLSLNDRVLVGVSGGPDSMALLYFLYCLKSQYSLYIHAAHLNHMLRGQESEEDTSYVEDFCRRFDIPCSVRYMDVHEISENEGLSLEEAGRKARYDFFLDATHEINATRIALAHNMNDQAETILMRLMRGTGLDGLGGIKPIRDGLYIRPLIHTPRWEIENYCRENNINPRIDSTNLLAVYARNKVRLELIPYIKENYNPNIESTLSSMAELLSDDIDFFNGYVGTLYKEVAVENSNRVSVDIKQVNLLHDSIKSRIIRRAVEQVKGDLTGIESRHIELILSIMASGSTGNAVELPGGIKARISYGNVEILIPEEEKPHGFSYRLTVPGSTCIPEVDGMIETEVTDRIFDSYDSNRFVKSFDYDKIKGNLIVRTRKNGDYIVPLGLQGSKKIKELFIDCKVPREKRDSVPIICDGDNIVWIVGYKMSEIYKVDNNTKKILKLKYMDCP